MLQIESPYSLNSPGQISYELITSDYDFETAPCHGQAAVNFIPLTSQNLRQMHQLVNRKYSYFL